MCLQLLCLHLQPSSQQQANHTALVLLLLLLIQLSQYSNALQCSPAAGVTARSLVRGNASSAVRRLHTLRRPSQQRQQLRLVALARPRRAPTRRSSPKRCLHCRTLNYRHAFNPGHVNVNVKTGFATASREFVT